jgi:hypothetical protein
MTKKHTFSIKPRRSKRTGKKAQTDPEAIQTTIAALDRVEPSNVKVAGLISLLKGWLLDESGYDEEVWPQLKKALDQERTRIGARRLFND